MEKTAPSPMESLSTEYQLLQIEVGEKTFKVKVLEAEIRLLHSRMLEIHKELDALAKQAAT